MAGEQPRADKASYPAQALAAADPARAATAPRPAQAASLPSATASLSKAAAPVAAAVLVTMRCDRDRHLLPQALLHEGDEVCEGDLEEERQLDLEL